MNAQPTERVHTIIDPRPGQPRRFFASPPATRRRAPRESSSETGACGGTLFPVPAIVREYPRHPLVGVGAIIVESGQVALVKRAHAPLVGEWSIPGGLVELGESLRQAVEREALEETGLVVEALELAGVFERIVPGGENRTRYHYVLVDYLCRRVSGTLEASGDAAEARWFLPGELPMLGLPEDTAAVIRLAIEKAEPSS
jgi:8-oxo-dGTP diphosphatase